MNRAAKSADPLTLRCNLLSFSDELKVNWWSVHQKTFFYLFTYLFIYFDNPDV